VQSAKENRSKIRHLQNKTVIPREEIPVNCNEISGIMNFQEGKPNADLVLDLFEKKDLSSVSGGSLAACVVYLLNIQDFTNADKIISFLEKNNSGAFTRFLRGEYYFMDGIAEEAEKFYHEAAVKDKFFWPAFYRIAILASEGNRTRFEYKVKKTIDSIELWHKLEQGNRLNYECFLGGFSPDYFRRILENKLV
jgi:chemotaxis protein methyltransferase CheR